MVLWKTHSVTLDHNGKIISYSSFHYNPLVWLDISLQKWSLYYYHEKCINQPEKMEDIWYHILEYISTQSLIQLQFISKSFHSVIQSLLAARSKLYIPDLKRCESHIRLFRSKGMKRRYAIWQKKMISDKEDIAVYMVDLLYLIIMYRGSFMKK